MNRIYFILSYFNWQYFWPLLIVPFTLFWLVVVAYWNEWRFSRRGLLIVVTIFALSCALSFTLMGWWGTIVWEILFPAGNLPVSEINPHCLDYQCSLALMAVFFMRGRMGGMTSNDTEPPSLPRTQRVAYSLIVPLIGMLGFYF